DRLVERDRALQPARVQLRPTKGVRLVLLEVAHPRRLPCGDDRARGIRKDGHSSLVPDIERWCDDAATRCPRLVGEAVNIVAADASPLPAMAVAKHVSLLHLGGGALAAPHRYCRRALRLPPCQPYGGPH